MIGWLFLFALLVFIEILTLGLTSIWFAGGALVAFVSTFFGCGFLVQMVLFVVVSLILLLFTRPIALRNFNSNREATNIDLLIGKEGKVLERVDNINESGRIILNGQEWTARSVNGEIVEVDSIVIVERIEGVKAIVTQKEVLSPANSEMESKEAGNNKQL